MRSIKFDELPPAMPRPTRPMPTHSGLAAVTVTTPPPAPPPAPKGTKQST